MPALANQASIDAKRKEMALEAMASRRAAADPLPGPLAKAFGPRAIRVVAEDGQEVSIRPLVAYDWVILKVINHPIYQQMLEIMQAGDKAKPDEIKYEPKDQWALVYMLMNSCEEVADVLDSSQTAFEKAARRSVSMAFSPVDVDRLVGACSKQILGHMDTMVRYSQEVKEQEAKAGPDFLTLPGQNPGA